MRSLLRKVRPSHPACVVCRQDVKPGDDQVQLRTGVAHRGCVGSPAVRRRFETKG